MEPLKEWICDVCRTVVKADGGSVLWDRHHPATGGVEFPKKFIIVHHRCDKNDAERIQNMPIHELLGPFGLMRLTEMLSRGPIAEVSQYLPNPDYASYVDVFRRLHVPYYEEARRYFPTETAQEWFSNGMVFGPEDLETFIAEAKKETPEVLAEGLL